MSLAAMARVWVLKPASIASQPTLESPMR